jgi:hypothetical protein
VQVAWAGERAVCPCTVVSGMDETGQRCPLCTLAYRWAGAKNPASSPRCGRLRYVWYRTQIRCMVVHWSKHPGMRPPERCVSSRRRRWSNFDPSHPEIDQKQNTFGAAGARVRNACGQSYTHRSATGRDAAHGAMPRREPGSRSRCKPRGLLRGPDRRRCACHAPERRAAEPDRFLYWLVAETTSEVLAMPATSRQ